MIFGRKIKCKEAVRKYYDEYTKGIVSGKILVGPRFGYNAQLNTCVVRVGFFDLGNPDQSYKAIDDALTGEVLFNTFGTGLSKDADFKRMETKFMGPAEGSSGDEDNAK